MFYLRLLEAGSGWVMGTQGLSFAGMVELSFKVVSGIAEARGIIRRDQQAKQGGVPGSSAV